MKGVDPKCMLFQKNGPPYGNLDLQPLHFNRFAPLRFLMDPFFLTQTSWKSLNMDPTGL